jgi:type III secretory pathway component EscV
MTTTKKVIIGTLIVAALGTGIYFIAKKIKKSKEDTDKEDKGSDETTSDNATTKNDSSTKTETSTPSESNEAKNVPITLPMNVYAKKDMMDIQNIYKKIPNTNKYKKQEIFSIKSRGTIPADKKALQRKKDVAIGTVWKSSDITENGYFVATTDFFSDGKTKVIWVSKSDVYTKNIIKK